MLHSSNSSSIKPTRSHFPPQLRSNSAPESQPPAILHLSRSAIVFHRNQIHQQLSDLFFPRARSYAESNSFLHTKRCHITRILVRKPPFPQPKSFNRMLVAVAAERSALSFLSQLLQLAIASSQPLNSACFLTVAKAFAKSDDCAELLRLTKQVMELTSPSMTVINRILFAFDECGETEKALLIFSRMKTLDFMPDLYTHNIVLEILGCAGRVDEMLGQFGSMKEADVVSYNTVLNNLRKLGKFDVCLFYYKEMGENGVEADLLTYTAVIESMGRSGNVEEALRFFDEMKARKIHPSLYVYRSLITNLKKMGKVDLALSLTEEMNSCDSELAGPMDFKRNKRL